MRVLLTKAEARGLAEYNRRLLELWQPAGRERELAECAAMLRELGRPLKRALLAEGFELPPLMMAELEVM
jgi:hypothetical protein